MRGTAEAVTGLARPSWRTTEGYDSQVVTLHRRLRIELFRKLSFILQLGLGWIKKRLIEWLIELRLADRSTVDGRRLTEVLSMLMRGG